jgi:hypothetical protein
MEVDDAATAKHAKEQQAKQQAKERDKRRRRIGLQKKTGIKDRQKEGGKNKKDAAYAEGDERGEGDDESTVAHEERGGRGCSTSKDPTSAQRRSKSKNKSDFDKAFPPPPKGSRRRSVPPPAKKSGGNRGSSVDSSTSRKSKKSDSDDSHAGDKRKRNPVGSTTKTAKFQDGIPDNEGKTASTRMTARAKKDAESAGPGQSYADKAKLPKKKNWAYEKILYYSMKVGKCTSTTGEVYGRLGNSFGVFLKQDPTCAIGNIYNAKKEPLRSPADFNFNSHCTFQQYFTVDEETDLRFDDGIKQDKPPRLLHPPV